MQPRRTHELTNHSPAAYLLSRSRHNILHPVHLEKGAETGVLGSFSIVPIKRLQRHACDMLNRRAISHRHECSLVNVAKMIFASLRYRRTSTVFCIATISQNIG
ncbi:hypothetical protein Y032_0032g2460 [Ancylostoma ceylanicum]|uniref:Uncharacterized protein n=1 Tax=Ancylostoma ceylanicum TaxID=53326 RepID=A0A016UNG9_9BILA|nr:hypothetical protein Y032_0032g2460 [Ancylostoma ceylanicum]